MTGQCETCGRVGKTMKVVDAAGEGHDGRVVCADREECWPDVSAGVERMQVSVWQVRVAAQSWIERFGWTVAAEKCGVTEAELRAWLRDDGE